MVSNKELLTNVLEKLKPQVRKLSVILIANSKDTPLNNRPNNKDIWIEFFSDSEVDYLINALRENALYVEVYFAEQDFIYKVLNHAYTNLEDLFVFNLARNGFGVGKKSLIPSFCDLMNIKYSGSNAYVCSLARNKYHCSQLFQHFDCSGTPSWLYNFSTGWLLGERPPEDLEVIIKPAFEAASKGITKNSIICTSDIEFMERIHQISMRNSAPILVQRFIRGYECQIPFIKLNEEIFFSPVGITIGSDYHLDDKIISETLSYGYSYDYYPAKTKLPAAVCDNMIRTAKRVSQIIDIDTYGRIDFRIDNQMTPFITDIATMPYIIAHSAFNCVFEDMGMTAKDIMLSIICSALINKYHYVV